MASGPRGSPRDSWVEDSMSCYEPRPVQHPHLGSVSPRPGSCCGAARRQGLGLRRFWGPGGFLRPHACLLFCFLPAWIHPPDKSTASASPSSLFSGGSDPCLGRSCREGVRPLPGPCPSSLLSSFLPISLLRPPGREQLPEVGVERGTGRLPKRYFLRTKRVVGKLARIL